MIGDGVNDVPALKQARLAIAQGSGTQMARSVADLVLVRDDFGVLPGMVAEGRQILRNIQRVARLFITKSVFTAVIGLAVAIPTGTFPLLPRQFTIASTVTIGIPAFLLALAPSSGPWRPERFLQIGRPLRDPGRNRDRDRDRRRLPARPLRVRPQPDPLAHGRDRDRRRLRARGRDAARDREPGDDGSRIAGLCALMAALFTLALVVPFLRTSTSSRPRPGSRRRLGRRHRPRGRDDAGRAAPAPRLSAAVCNCPQSHCSSMRLFGRPLDRPVIHAPWPVFLIGSSPLGTADPHGSRRVVWRSSLLSLRARADSPRASPSRA